MLKTADKQQTWIRELWQTVPDAQPEAVNREEKHCTLLVVGRRKEFNMRQTTM